MKIGILTYHRTFNYGGCLQALAIRLILEKFGHRAYYIDYWPDYHKQSYSLLPIKLLWQAPSFASGIRSLLVTIKSLPYVLKRRNNFNRFLDECIIPYCKSLNEEYEVIVYGSDQIWRKQPIIDDYNPIYFAQNEFKARQHVAFSASMGILPESESDIEKIKSLIKHFDKISVRENDLCTFLTYHRINEAIVTLDPTLLVSRNMWDTIIKSSEYNGPKYVLFYELNKGAFDINKIRQFASERALLLKTISGFAINDDSETEINTAGPYEFVYWIKNAEYVFTSSFHGLAFSLIYEKEVFVSLMVNYQRAKSLLESVGISERFIDLGMDIPKNLSTIDYRQVNSAIDQLKEKSINYIISL